MNLKQSILLGLLQGVAEFLPISSSGHIELLKGAMGLESVPLLLETFLHLGTLLAVFAAYWSDIRDMVLEFFRGDAIRGHAAGLSTSQWISLVIIAASAAFVIWYVQCQRKSKKAKKAER